MKKNILWLLLLLSFQLAFGQEDQLEPRKVAKTGDVIVPEGMYLAKSRTGERWLLPESMEAPPEQTQVKPAQYYKAEKNPKKLSTLNGHTVVDAAYSAEDVFRGDEEFWGKIPSEFSELLKNEKDLNLHGQSDHFSFLGDFGPDSKRAFYLPYIPIPEEDLPFSYLSDAANSDTKKFVVTEVDGKKIYRCFFHPNYPNSVKELIEKYGAVYHYVAVTTSSPRSLIVLDPSDGKLHWVKPSLPKKIDGSIRLNIDTKLRRAVILSEALATLTAADRAKYHVGFMLEPASVQFPGKAFGTIFRELNPSLVNPAPGKSWLPAFALNAPGKSGKFIIEEMIEKSGKPAKQFIDESIVRPFLRTYLSLALEEGLPGEMHTQNFYYELDSHGLPTGEFIFKDNDGFRFDVEIAMRKGRAQGYLSKFDRPFYWAKFSNALGTGAEGVPFLGSWYYKLIRNVNGFETLSSYILSVMEKSGDPTWTKDGIQRFFDDIAIDEAQKITGVELAADVKYGFGQDKGLNAILNEHRKRLAIANDLSLRKQKESKELQTFLASKYEELKGLNKVHERSSLNTRTFFVSHTLEDGTIIIEARDSAPRNKSGNPVKGLAIIEKSSNLEKEVSQKLLDIVGNCDT